MFSWWFGWFFRINVYHCFFNLNILSDEVGRGHEHGKQCFVRYHLYRFFLKNCYGWLKLMTCR